LGLAQHLALRATLIALTGINIAPNAGVSETFQGTWLPAANGKAKML
jgi:hypothetical protein